MAEADWTYLNDGLDIATVDRGVTAGIARPPGGDLLTSDALIARDRATACDKGRVMSVAESLIQVGLASWIIQDGNYGDFTVGQQAKFALEFGALNGLRAATEGPLNAEPAGRITIPHPGSRCLRLRGRVGN